MKEVQGNQNLLEYISFLSLMIIITYEINRTQRRKEKLYGNRMQIS
jgi:preprotein translocase subunit YajC